jgi:hypothetical protein
LPIVVLLRSDERVPQCVPRKTHHPAGH